MNTAFQTMIDQQLETFRAWLSWQEVTSYRLVQFCGPEFIGSKDLHFSELDQEIEGLLAEGFYFDWLTHQDRIYLRVWEFGSPEPAWDNVFEERDISNSGENPYPSS